MSGFIQEPISINDNFDFIIDRSPDYLLLENIENIPNLENINEEKINDINEEYDYYIEEYDYYHTYYNNYYNNYGYLETKENEENNIYLNNNVNNEEIPMDIDNNLNEINNNELNIIENEYNNTYGLPNLNYYLNSDYINTLNIEANNIQNIIYNLNREHIRNISQQLGQVGEQQVEDRKHNILIYYLDSTLLSIKDCECCICMEDKQTEKYEICKLSCGHEFCVDCIAQLLQKSLNDYREPCCPLCRGNIGYIYTQKLIDMYKLNQYCELKLENTIIHNVV